MVSRARRSKELFERVTYAVAAAWEGVTHPKAGPMCAGMAPPMPLEKFHERKFAGAAIAAEIAMRLERIGPTTEPSGWKFPAAACA